MDEINQTPQSGSSEDDSSAAPTFDTPTTPLALPIPAVAPVYAQSAPTTGTSSMPTNSLAVISLALSISSWVLLFGIGGVAGIILGILARNKIKNSHGTQGGDGMALAGIILGVANVALVCFGILCFGALIFAGITSN